MDERRYSRIKEVFLACCDLDAAGRRETLERECAEDERLRAEVEALLSEHDVPGPPDELPTRATNPRAGDGSKDRVPSITGYRIVRELGHGGMGVVYLGQREGDKFRKRVAIKVLKKGLDTDHVLRRFDLERQVLAALNHPNIARLYDGGQTNDGRPYFIMEHVEGDHLDDYADAHRLTISERLDLFRDVCSAVQYAHQNLIVHRDLKPSNVIVTEKGVPKLLDFGIAKIINPELSLVTGNLTATELRVMTPQYASPEQIRGSSITTATDVYSLGVILYELLTGHRPYRVRSRIRAELERLICEEDPDRPSTAITLVEEVEVESETGTSSRSITPETVSRSRGGLRPERLRKRLTGDLDNIILMAMRKEPQRRYNTVEQLSEDIRRHLDDLPVVARRDSLGYRASKFVRRNRAGVAVAALVLLSTVLSIVAILALGWARAEGERADALMAQREAETGRVQALADRDAVQTVLGVLLPSIERLPNAIEAREKMITTALDELTEREAQGDVSRVELARTYSALGEIHGSVRNPSKGELDVAMEAQRRAIRLFEEAVAETPDEPDTRRRLAMTRIALADQFDLRGQLDEARRARTQALRELRDLVAQRPRSEDLQRSLAIALLEVGKSHARADDDEQAERLYRESVAIREALRGSNRADADLMRDLSVGYLRIAGCRGRAQDPEGALSYYRKALDLRKKVVDLNPATNRHDRDLAVAHLFVGRTYRQLDRASEAREHLSEYVRITRELAVDSPGDVRAQKDLLNAHQTMGDLLLFTESSPEEALEFYEQYNTRSLALADDFGADTTIRRHVATSFDRLGRALHALDRVADALARFRRAEEEFARLPESRSRQADLESVRGTIERIEAEQLQAAGGS